MKLPAIWGFRPVALLAAALLVVAAAGGTALTWGQAEAKPDIDRTTVEDARLMKLLAGSAEVWLEGKTDKPVVSGGQFQERTRIAGQDVLIFREGGDRVLVRASLVSAIRIK